MTVHKDFLGKELAIGDFVIFIRQGYRSFKLANVIGLTPKKVRVKWGDQAWAELLQEPKSLVKVEGPDLTMFLLQQDHTNG